MKKAILPIIIILLLLSGYFLWSRNNTTDAPEPTTTPVTTEQFTSADQSIKFTYPTELSVTQKNNIITLHHQIVFQHIDACDFKGDGTTTPNLTDFHVTIQLFNMTVASTSKIISPYIPEENIQGDTLKINPGFIDTYNNSPWNGYAIFEGAEGCGVVTYYLPISSSRTLVIKKEFVGELSDVYNPATKEKILAVPGVISPSQSESLFNALVQSLQVR